MSRFLKMILIVGLLAVSVGCGQKGDLYMPNENTAQKSEL